MNNSLNCVKEANNITNQPDNSAINKFKVKLSYIGYEGTNEYDIFHKLAVCNDQYRVIFGTKANGVISITTDNELSLKFIEYNIMNSLEFKSLFNKYLANNKFNESIARAFGEELCNLLNNKIDSNKLVVFNNGNWVYN
jgi:hypothetical protein